MSEMALVSPMAISLSQEIILYFISPAALLVKVIARILRGEDDISGESKKDMYLLERVKVLPEPAEADTTRMWGKFKFSLLLPKGFCQFLIKL